MDPLLVVDLETSGFPGGRSPDFTAAVLEVGLAIVTDQGIAEATHFLVKPPGGMAHLQDRRAGPALDHNGLDPDEVMSRGLDPSAGAATLAAGIAHAKVTYGVTAWTAYNLDFEVGFLSRPPWVGAILATQLPTTSCIMLASTLFLGGRGALPTRKHKGKDHGRNNPCPWKFASLAEAVEYLRKLGHGIPGWGGGASGVGGKSVLDATLAGGVALALSREGAYP